MADKATTTQVIEFVPFGWHNALIVVVDEADGSAKKWGASNFKEMAVARFPQHALQVPCLLKQPFLVAALLLCLSTEPLFN
jgi:hypothetical protein